MISWPAETLATHTPKKRILGERTLASEFLLLTARSSQSSQEPNLGRSALKVCGRLHETTYRV